MVIPLPETLPQDSMFGLDGWEEVFDEIEEVVRKYVECQEFKTIAECIEASEWPLVVNEYKRMKKPSAERMLERLLEDWHEDYGDPSGEPEAITPGRLSAMQMIIDSLTVWGCEQTTRAFLVSKEDAKRMLEGEE